jgi:hypothetical protein
LTKDATHFVFQGEPQTSWNISTVFALDTEKIVAWKFCNKELHIWLQGILEPLRLREDSPELGSKDNFLSLLLCLQAEYKDFDEWMATPNFSHLFENMGLSSSEAIAKHELTDHD